MSELPARESHPCRRVPLGRASPQAFNCRRNAKAANAGLVTQRRTKLLSFVEGSGEELFDGVRWRSTERRVANRSACPHSGAWKIAPRSPQRTSLPSPPRHLDKYSSKRTRCYAGFDCRGETRPASSPDGRKTSKSPIRTVSPPPPAHCPPGRRAPLTERALAGASQASQSCEVPATPPGPSR